MVVAPGIGLVPKEEDLIVVLQVAQAVGLVPPFRKHVKTYLPPDRILQPIVCKFLLEMLDKGAPDTVLLVKLLESLSFSL